MPSPASPLSPDAQQAAALIPPDDIEARSFAIIDGEIPEPRPFTGYAWEVARRLVHTSGDISLPGDLYLPDESVCGGVQALRRGCAIFTDTRMACSGIPARRLAPLNSSVQCLLDLPGAPAPPCFWPETLFPAVLSPLAMPLPHCSPCCNYWARACQNQP